jgi:hypothetical protein
MLKEVIHFLAIVGGDPSVATNAPQGDINPRHAERKEESPGRRICHAEITHCEFFYPV